MKHDLGVSWYSEMIDGYSADTWKHDWCIYLCHKFCHLDQQSCHPLNVSWPQTHLVTFFNLTFSWWKESRQILENFLHNIRSIPSTTTIKSWGSGACVVKKNKTRILIGSAEWHELCVGEKMQCLWEVDRHGTSRVVLDFTYSIATILTRRGVP